MALRDIIARLGIEIEEGGLHEFKENIEGAKEKLKDLTEVLGAGLFGEAVKEFVKGQIEAGAQLKDMSMRLGIGTDELQKFQLAAELSGASAQDANTGLRFLNRTIGQAASGAGDGADAFNKLGIELKNTDGSTKSSTDIAMELAEKLKDVKSQGERTAIAMKVLGRGGVALLPMFQKGKEGLKEAFDAFEELGGGMQGEFVESAKKADDEMIKLKFAMTGLKSRIATALIPGFVDATKRMMGFVMRGMEIVKHTYIMKTGFAALKLGAVVATFMKLYKILNIAKMGMGGFVKQLLGVAWPIVLIGALYLIFDDLFTLMNGGKSVIGDWITKTYGIETTTNFVRTLQETWLALQATWSDLGPIISDVTIEAVKSAIDLVKSLYHGLQGVIAVAAGSADAFTGDIGSAKARMAQAKGYFEESGKEFVAAFTNDDHHGKMNASPPAAVSIPGSSYTVQQAPTTHVHIENNISGVSDPEKAAKAATEGTRKAINGTQLRSAFAAVGTGT